MIVPEDDMVREPDPQISGESSTENLVMDIDIDPAADQADCEVDEVQNLQELARKLEIQNQQLRPGNQANVPHEERQIYLDTDNQYIGPDRGFSSEIEKQSQLYEINPEMKESKDLKGDGDMQVEVSRSTDLPKYHARKSIALVDSGSSTVGVDISTRPKLTTSKMPEQISTMETESGSFFSDTSLFGPILDDVEILELGDLCEGDDSNWLYALPRSTPPVKEKTESLLKWCRQTLDHPSPETKAACSAFLEKLDQASRQKTLCQSTLAPSSVQSSFIEPPFAGDAPNVPMALESASKPLFSWDTSGLSGISPSQSTFKETIIDWPSDESMSKDCKLQYFTDMQVPQLQKESLLEEHAYASVSAPYKMPSASFHSRRGSVFSEQELYNIGEDQDDSDCLPAFSNKPRYASSSLPSLPPYQSPSTSGDYVKVVPPPMISPKRSKSGSRLECKKWPDSEDELYTSMPSKIRSSLRSLSSVRSSHGLDWDIQIPKGRLSRIQESVGLVPSKIRFSSSIGKPLLNIRKPMKAEPSVILNPRKPIKREYSNPAVDQKPEASFSPGPLRRHLSPTSIASVATVSKGSSVEEETLAAEASSLENK
ncbi:SLAIN motif-containing protein-like [Dromiciops gliroides]|uniref:SLAIN motif-containing protein-like n=1 Tax=Dromiciops gliroides TaxID=33562 RepID=UPI001CC4D418|nr:SLAIN motif-containing protein-like [Dromiciops gliroides]